MTVHQLASAVLPHVAVATDLWSEVAGFWTTNGGLVVQKTLASIGVIIGALLVRWVFHFVIDRVVRQVVSGATKKAGATDTIAMEASPLVAARIVQRTRTLGTVLANSVNVVLFVVGVLLIVNLIDPTILGSFALLSAAVGAALGFGAQNIVKDALSGLFMVVEDQLGVGDIVDLGTTTGVVEDVRLRITTVRDVNGTLWFVRNGEITRVGNMSQGWARVILDLSVPYGADLDTVETAVLRTAVQLSQSARWRSRVLEKPEMWGLESISAEVLVIRVAMKVRTSAKDDVARELRVRIKRTLDEMGVRPANLTSVTLSGSDEASRVKGARPPKRETVAPSVRTRADTHTAAGKKTAAHRDDS